MSITKNLAPHLRKKRSSKEAEGASHPGSSQAHHARCENERSDALLQHRWFNRVLLPTGVIRVSRVVYASQALLKLLDLQHARQREVDFFEPIAPADRARIQAW